LRPTPANPKLLLNTVPQKILGWQRIFCAQVGGSDKSIGLTQVNLGFVLHDNFLHLSKNVTMPVVIVSF
jgi:hypothetical protein